MNNTVNRSSGGKRVQTKANKEKKFVLLTFIIILVVVAVVVFGLVKLNGIVDDYDKIYNGVTLLGADLGGMTKEEAEAYLAQNYSNNDVEIVLKYTSADDVLESTAISFKTDIDTAAAAEAAWQAGRNGSKLEKAISIVKGKKVTVDYSATMDTSGIKGFIESVADRINRDGADYDVDTSKDVLSFKVGQSGRTFDTAAAAAALEELASKGVSSELDLDQFVNETSASSIDLDKLYNNLHKDVVNAEYVYGEDGVTVTQSAVGVDFDLELVRSKLANEESDFDVPIIYTEPERYTDDLKEKLFRDQLASVKTTLNKWNYNRTGNVKLSANSINDVILAPDQEFSYNNIVGQRTYENGYRNASVYVSTGIEDQLGGGICQTSSTLYMAVIRSRLKIIERANHAYTVAYAPNGQDATVYWGSVDFKFKNNREYPIKIVAWQEDDYVQVEIYGTDVDNYTVTIELETLETVPYTTKEINNPELDFGKKKQIVEGHNAVKCNTYAVVKDKDGNVVDRYKIAYSKYKRLDKVVEVGTKGAPTATPSAVPTDTPTATATPAELPAVSTPEPVQTPEPAPEPIETAEPAQNDTEADKTEPTFIPAS